MLPFISALFFPLYSLITNALPDDGGSSPEAPAPLTVPAAPSFKAIASGMEEIARDTVNFTAVHVVKSDAPAGSFDLARNPGIAFYTAGRLSARIIGPLHLTMKIFPLPTGAQYIYANGTVALRRHLSSAKPVYPSGPQLGMCPFSVVLTATMNGSTSASMAQLPVRVVPELLLPQVFGERPQVVYDFALAGIDHVELHVSGQIHVSGFDEMDFQ
jgi:hypothetical protein